MKQWMLAGCVLAMALAGCTEEQKFEQPVIGRKKSTDYYCGWLPVQGLEQEW